MAEEVICSSCSKGVNEDSHSIQCDACNKWAHINCVGVTKQAYKLGGKLQGFQWFCPNCLVDWRDMRVLVKDIASQFQRLQEEASKVPRLEDELAQLQSTVKEMAGVVDLLTSTPPGQSYLPKKLVTPIPESPNRYAVLQHLDDGDSPTGSEPANPVSHLSNDRQNQAVANDAVGFQPPQTQLPSSPSRNDDSSCTPRTPSQKPILLYLRNVPSQLSIQDVQEKLTEEGVSLEGCSLSLPGESITFTGPRKFLKVTFDSIDRCNSLDKALKSKPHLRWFLKLFPPRRPSRRTTNLRSSSNANAPRFTPNRHFLSKGPPHQKIPSMQPLAQHHPPIGQTRIPALMSLRLPPLPVRMY